MPKRPRAEAPVPRVEEEEEEEEEEDDEGQVELDSEEETAVAVASRLASRPPPKESVANVAGLRQALHELVEPDLPWVERLEVVAAEDLPAIAPDDDLKLELAFYGQALAAVAASRAELERLGIPHRRPDDYFAEMMKSDQHMQKVKDKLIVEAKRIAAVDARRKEKAASKFGKKVAADRVAERAGAKRAQLDAIKQWRTKKDVGAAGSGGGGSAARSAEIEGVLADKPAFHSGARGPAAGAAGAAGGQRAAAGKPSGARRAKDKKFGFGGRSKRDAKDNTARSSASLKEFSSTRNRALPPGMAGKGGGGKPGGGGHKAQKGGARAGQHARQAARSRSAAGGRR